MLIHYRSLANNAIKELPNEIFSLPNLKKLYIIFINIII